MSTPLEIVDEAGNVHGPFVTHQELIKCVDDRALGDAINAAVREINPDAGTMARGSMTLGSDFDEWLGPEAFRKYGFGPLPPEAVAACAQLRSALESLVSAVGNMKVPQTALDAALMLHVTLGPTYERAKQAIAR